jgi:hypothetical protein
MTLTLVGACGYPRPERITGSDAGADASDSAPQDSAMCVASPANLRARWRAEGNVRDDTANFDGMPVGNLMYTAGRHGRAFKFNGVDSLVTADPTDSLWPVGSFSIEAWVKTTVPAPATGTTISFVQKYDCADPGCGTVAQPFWLLDLDSAGHALFDIRVSAGGGSPATGTTTINDGAWHHLVGVRDNGADAELLYVDGNLESQIQSLGGSFLAAMTNGDGMSDPITIGGRRAHTGSTMMAYTAYIAAEIDEVAYYESAISAEQVAAIYAAPDGICP